MLFDFEKRSLKECLSGVDDPRIQKSRSIHLVKIEEKPSERWLHVNKMPTRFSISDLAHAVVIFQGQF
jgi:hypothetical protein